MIRVVVIEDQDLFRLGITTAISQSEDMEMCADANCGSLGLELVEQNNPDIVLVDVGLPDINGLEVTAEIKRRTDSKVIILTCYSSQEVVDLALKCGADSYLFKKSNLESIKYGIRQIYYQSEYIEPVLMKRFFSLSRQKAKGKYAKLLTCKEIVVLKLIACGYSNKEIAEELFLTLSAVKSHVQEILFKLGARDRVNALIQAQRLGYLEQFLEE